MDVIWQLLFFAVIAVVVGLVFLRARAKRKAIWGLGAVMGAPCPRCGAPLPAIRKPSTMQETLWGGWTCPNCGCKVDRYGAERIAK